MNSQPEPRTENAADAVANAEEVRSPSAWHYGKRALSAASAVIGMYFGGFLWEEVSPLAYSVVFLILASTPLLLKISFWKKLVLLFPVLIVRVIGKVLIKLFGLKGLEKLFRRYGLLEARYHKLLSGVNDTRVKSVNKWNRLSRTTRAHLILAFLPVLTLVALAALIIKLVRFRVLQMAVEKVMQKGVQDKIQHGVLNASNKLKQKQAKKIKEQQGESNPSDHLRDSDT